MKAVALSDRGRMRSNNEDTVYCSVTKVGKLPNLFVVADGMGGANAGEFASCFAVDQVCSRIRRNRHDKEYLSIIRNAIESTNSDLYKDSMKHPDHYGCGTTMVASFIRRESDSDAEGEARTNRIFAANIGDSRLYIIGDSIRQVTHDHSYVEEMVRQGMMIRNSKDYMAKKNIITRAVGVCNEVQIDFFEETANDDETILLCTDGLSNMLDDQTIFSIVTNAESVEKAAQKLVEAANEQGGTDNISVILISELGA